MTDGDRAGATNGVQVRVGIGHRVLMKVRVGVQTRVGLQSEDRPGKPYPNPNRVQGLDGPDEELGEGGG